MAALHDNLNRLLALLERAAKQDDERVGKFREALVARSIEWPADALAALSISGLHVNVLVVLGTIGAALAAGEVVPPALRASLKNRLARYSPQGE
jgi:hypothetical protein